MDAAVPRRDSNAKPSSQLTWHHKFPESGKLLLLADGSYKLYRLNFSLPVFSFAIYQRHLAFRTTFLML